MGAYADLLEEVPDTKNPEKEKGAYAQLIEETDALQDAPVSPSGMPISETAEGVDTPPELINTKPVMPVDGKPVQKDSIDVSKELGIDAAVDKFRELADKGQAYSLKTGAEYLTGRAQERNKLKFGKGADKFLAGLKQTYLEVFDTEEAAMKYAALKTKDREVFEKAFEEEYGDTLVSDLMEFAGEAMPYFAIPAAQSSFIGIKTLLGRMVYASATGAAAAGTQFSEDDLDRIKAARDGGLLGLAVLLPFEVTAKLKNAFNAFMRGKDPKKIIQWVNEKNYLIDKLDNGNLSPAREKQVLRALSKLERKLAKSELAKGEKAIEDAARRQKVNLGIEHKSQDPMVKSLVRTAEGSTAGQRAKKVRDAKMVRDVAKAWIRIKGVNNPKTVSGATRIMSAFEDTTEALIKNRTANCTKYFDQAIKQFGDQRVIKVDNFLDVLAKNIKAGQGRFAGKQSRNFAKELVAYRKRILRGGGPEANKATVAELQQLLADFGRSSKGKDSIFATLKNANNTKPYRDLYKALEKDLNSSGDELGGALKLARDKWKTDSQLIRGLEKSAIGRFLGKNVDRSPEEAYKAFMAMGKANKMQTIDLLKKADPDLHRSIGHDFIDDIFQKAHVREAPSDVFPFDFDKMMDVVQNDDTFKLLFSPQQQKNIKDMVRVTRAIAKDPPTGAAGTFKATIKELPGIVASRDKAFIARAGGELTVPRLIARIMLTEHGPKMLNLMVQPYNSARAAALASLIKDELSNTEYRE